tara:strand:- start:4854 stop:9059 length:4206 start_codon:yes stop_codon:yes gene_type:complete
MAKDNEIIIKIVTSDKGTKATIQNQKKLQKEAGKTADAQKNVGKQTDNTNKKEKALYQQNLSSAKGFSKMNQTMGSGSSGLVGAYATLAANVFAATAAFNALRGAAQVQTLIEGFTFLGNAAGQTSMQIARGLRDITDGAISMEVALRSSAIAMTSGFNTDQISKLGEVAKNASIALGRNMSDSIDRLFRGVAKLEPEILDELGIMVRLDTAVTKYATSLGKSGTELTGFERRQAFLNETLTQGALKYGSIGDAVETNPYDRLSAAFGDLTEKGLNLINKFLTPFLTMLSKSSGALVGGLILFGSTILTTMIPALGQLAEKQMKVAATAAHMAAAEAKAGKEAAVRAKMNFVGKGPGATGPMAKTVKGGDFSAVKSLKKAMKGRNQTEEDFKKAIQQVSNTRKRGQTIAIKNGTVNTAAHQKRMMELQALENQIIAVQKAENNRGASAGDSAISNSNALGQEGMANQMGLIQGAGVKEGFGLATKGFKDFRAEQKKGMAEWTKNGLGKKGMFGKWGKSLMGAFKLGGAGARLFGAALMNAIPIIGQILFFGGMLITFLAGMRGKASESSVALDNLNETLDKAKEKFEQLAETNSALPTTLQDLDRSFRETAISAMSVKNEINTLGGISKEARDNYEIFTRALAKEEELGRMANAWSRLKVGVAGFGESVKNFIPKLKEFMINGLKAMFPLLTKLVGFMEKIGLIDAVQDTISAAGTAVKDFVAPVETAGAAMDRQIRTATETGTKLIKSLGAENEALRKQYEGFDFGVAFREAEAEILKFGPAVVTFAKLQEIVNNKFAETSKPVERSKIAVNSLNTSFEEMGKVFNKNVDGILKRNSFDKIASSIGTLNIDLAQLKTDGMASADVMNQIKLAAEAAGVDLDKYGISTAQVAQNIKDGKAPFGELQEDMEKLAKLTRSAASEKKKLKNELMLLNAEFGMNKALDEYALKLSNFRKTGKFDLSPADSFSNAIASTEKAKKLAMDQFLIKTQQIEAEYALEEFKLKVFTAIAKSKGMEEEMAKLQEILATSKAAQHAANAMNFVTKTTAEDGNKLTTLQNAGKEGSVGERAGTATSAANDADATRGSRIENIRNATQPMREALEALGPEGELVSAAQMGVLSIADSFTILGDKTASASDKLGAVSDAIGAIGSIMSANSKAQIAEIDGQISAEKNRDGKSKESLAKIKAMEKKKEQMARKAFEMNKKMQIAQAIASTASAVVGALSAKPSGPWNIPIAAMYGAMGLAQVAIIRKSKFQGGASDVPKPTSTIAVGKRDNRVDVSQGASAGETAYLRGGKGVGSNANSFTPGGAAGMRGYAAGGEGILVGERGPEIVQPTAPIDIIPNNKLGGGAQNVNFTINAVDAQGVQDVLQRQRGNIIGMIREAANEHGETFMESINTEAY